MLLLKLVVLPIFAYLIGSIPFGLVFTRCFGSVNLRGSGSRNIGATNVLRTAGPLLGGLTLAADGLKGAVPLGLAMTITVSHGPLWELYLALVATAAVSGHLFPVYTRFNGGGKGVATAAGCFLVISPLAGTVSILVFILLFCLTGRVSAGSLAGAAVLPLSLWKATQSEIFTGCAIGVVLLIFYRHRENIVRLLSGKEPPV